jgi:hypothetical protein
VKLCYCGCGQPVSQPHCKYLPACQKRAKAQRRLEHKSLSRRSIVMGTRSAPMKPKKAVCKVCFDLSERRERVCPGCGLPWAVERRSA